MYKKINKLKFKLRKLYYNLYSSVKYNKKNKSIAIISCDKYCGKIREDIDLKYYLNKNNINANIISWKSNINVNKYDAAIIRSIWDFQMDLENFINWLENINIPVFNNINLIFDNIDKEKQYSIMDKYNIKHVDTIFFDNKNLNLEFIYKNCFTSYEKLILKPSISESGKNTYLLDRNKLKNIDLNSINGKIMIQPFLDDVKNGEYSVIYFNHKYSHCILRFPGVVDKLDTTKEVKIDDKLLEICNKIESIEEYKDYLYLRLDFIKHNNDYILLESELIDPMLFINTSKNNKKIYQNFVKSIQEKLQK